MSALWIVTLSLTVIFPGHAVDFTRPSFVSVRSGESVKLDCTIQDSYSKELKIWYKQQFGEIPQEVGKNRAHVDAHIKPEFSSRVKVDEIANGISLTIVRVKKSDEALYFCGLFNWGKFRFSNGTFIAVTGETDENVSVLHRSVRDSAWATLQCSVLSESTTAGLRVLWFRSAPSQSHPQIIYTHHNNNNSTDQCRSSKRTCVYNITNISVNDTGTYYCAVVLCGRIVFGNGIALNAGPFTDQRRDDSVVICLAVALAVCVTVIFAQAILICKKRRLETHTARPPQSAQIHTTCHQDREALEPSYAALNFTKGET